MGRRGLSLVETLIAIFIITFAVLEMAALFRSLLDGAKRANKVTLANVLASKRMEEIIYWAGEDDNFKDWSSIDGAKVSDSQYPDFVIQSDSEAVVQYSPCSLTELRFPVAEQRIMKSSARKVRVRVTWSPTNIRNQVILHSLVGAPLPELDKVVIKGSIPGTIGPSGSSVALTVRGEDAAGKVISDLFFDWTLMAGTGNGELQPSRDGRSVEVVDRVYNEIDATYKAVPGTATLRVMATGGGIFRKQVKIVDFGP